MKNEEIRMMETGWLFIAFLVIYTSSFFILHCNFGMSRKDSHNVKLTVQNPSRQHRRERLAEALREEVSDIVNFELEDERIRSVDITAVKLDRERARVFVYLTGEPDEITTTVEALNHAANYIRQQVVVRLNLHKTPHLHFVYDAQLASALRIEAVLKEEADRVSEGT